MGEREESHEYIIDLNYNLSETGNDSFNDLTYIEEITSKVKKEKGG